MPTGTNEFLTVSIESVLVEKVEGSSPVAKRLWRDVLSRDNALEILDNNTVTALWVSFLSTMCDVLLTKLRVFFFGLFTKTTFSNFVEIACIFEFVQNFIPSQTSILC